MKKFIFFIYVTFVLCYVFPLNAIENIFGPDCLSTVEIGQYGGLGNIMFEYAGAYAYAKKHGKQLYIDDKNYLLRNLFHVSARSSSENPGLFSRLEPAIQQKLQYQKSPWLEYFDEKTYLNPNYSYLSGHMRSEKFFKEFSDDIRREFTFKQNTSDRNKKIIKEMTQTNSVCLHIRRGDYIKNAMPLMSRKYYDNAVHYIQERDKQPMHIYIFSNDIRLAKHEFQTSTPHTFVEGNKDWEDMMLMSHCRHNIIANSTFSWWGAWLNPNPNKIVIAPDEWYRRDLRLKDEIVPETWIKMPAYSIKPQKIAILYIPVEKDFSYWKQFYFIMNRYFLPNHIKKYFVLTNNITEQLSQFDYIYILKDNLISEHIVDEKILPNEKQKLMFMFDISAGNLNNHNEKEYRITDIFWGGKTKDVLHLINSFPNGLNQPVAKNISLNWHNKTYLNEYVMKLMKQGVTLLFFTDKDIFPKVNKCAKCHR